MARTLIRRVLLLVVLGPEIAGRPAPGAVTHEEVERAIRDGSRYLREQQQRDGSWADADAEAQTGTTSLVTLALLNAGEPADSPPIVRALALLRTFGPDQLRSVYATSLQTMTFAAADPARDLDRIARNVRWLEQAQIRPGDRVSWPGSWTYSTSKGRNGDNSNTSFALLALDAAAEVGVPVRPETWALSGRYWHAIQRDDGGWGYTANLESPSTGCMTAEGISSLILARMRRAVQESPSGARTKGVGSKPKASETIRGCGTGSVDPKLLLAIGWLGRRFRVSENIGNGQQWKFCYLTAVERAGALGGRRLFGGHDWFREGAEELVRTQDKLQGSWKGVLVEKTDLLPTSLALLFLARGRAPVLIQKARHGPEDDWTNDPEDVGHLVRTVSRDWKRALNWQILDLDDATVDDLLTGPILFLNGHEAPKINKNGNAALREYIKRGGFIFAEACCGRGKFDDGFRTLLKEVFPEPESQLHPLAKDHPVWTARHHIKVEDYPLWGIDRGRRTVLIYSPGDLSCGWNLRTRYPAAPLTVKALQVGQNVVEYATGRKLPLSKLTDAEAREPE
jgi:hypothetical protein